MILGNNRGIALVMVLLVIAVLLGITGASVFFSGLDLRIAKNHSAGTGAIQAADAGIQHGLALLPVGTDFNSLLQGSVSGFPCGSPCNGTTNKPTLTATLSAYSYTVVAENDPNDAGGPTNDTNRLVTFTSTANGPSSSQRKIKAFIGRSNSWAPPGAVFIPGSPTSLEGFDPNSTSWAITGNDTNYNNTSGPQPAIPGIASPNSSIVAGITSILNTEGRSSQVTGAGYSAGPPVTPSVQTTTRTDDVNAMAQSFINQITATTCPPKCLTGYNSSLSTCPATNPCTLGTDTAPQITYITGSGGSDTSLGGYVNGSGVLVVKTPELVLLDHFNFHGLVIHLQSTQVGNNLSFVIKGSAQIYGGLVLGPNNNQLEIEIDNSAAIKYSSSAITMVNNNWGSCCLPSRAKLIAWYEPMQ